MKETHRLVNLHITRIATVDNPDNPPARIVLFKRRKMAKDIEVKAEDIAKLPENVQKLLKDLTDKAEQNDTKVKDAEKATGLLAKIGKLFKGESNAVEPDVVVKDADPKVQAAYAAMKKLAEGAEATAKATLDRLDRNEMIEIAKSVPHLGQVDDVAGELLVLKNNVSEETWDAYLKRQRGIAAQLKDSVLFKEMGAGDAGASKGADALTAITKSIRATDPKLTEAQAMVKALDTVEGRAAYKEHDAERRDR